MVAMIIVKGNHQPRAWEVNQWEISFPKKKHRTNKLLRVDHIFFSFEIMFELEEYIVLYDDHLYIHINYSKIKHPLKSA